MRRKIAAKAAVIDGVEARNLRDLDGECRARVGAERAFADAGDELRSGDDACVVDDEVTMFCARLSTSLA